MVQLPKIATAPESLQRRRVSDSSGLIFTASLHRNSQGRETPQPSASRSQTRKSTSRQESSQMHRKTSPLGVEVLNYGVVHNGNL
ncbi:unnamed protein product [Cuscuta campestris]|uniref:Uncharacterized protein n=1 Tax=Cuscuta campestris TaxID=132261 RepID=A0A484KDG0_9ASTE|nr:unnamed protein product [Cuscuta campestris]